MVFGSAGTITTLADTDTRLTGETKVGSLTVLRRPRLKTLLDILKSQPPAQRASLISGDPKRADIIVAGGMVLLEVMTQLELDYIFVSQRGLRDGLMIDLLHKHDADAAPGQQDAEDTESLEQIGQKYNFDAPHARQVAQLALSIFYQLQKLHQLDEKHAAILRAAAMLHEFLGWFNLSKTTMRDLAQIHGHRLNSCYSQVTRPRSTLLFLTVSSSLRHRAFKFDAHIHITKG